MKEYAKDFYSSKKWKKTREAYWKQVGGLCENCLKQGIYKPGVIVHHVEHITQENITNPEITLNFDNLKLLCRECHEKVHDKRKRRYKLDEMGRVIFL